MKMQEALQILELEAVPDPAGLKKQYRKLMMIHHPDQDANKERAKGHHAAALINEAYTWLLDGLINGQLIPGDRAAGSKIKPEQEEASIWNAPQNPGAFCSREVFAEVEDSEGQVVAVIPIARGRFFWTRDEEFPFFMRSIRRAAEGLLDRIDQKMKRERDAIRYRQLLPELSFLLAQQFIDAPVTLTWLCRESKFKTDQDQSEVSVYEARAMLEIQNNSLPILGGEHLLPSRFADYRLYVKKVSGEELGYLSFPDDRLYYVLIPLFRQRSVQVQILVEEERESASAPKPGSRQREAASRNRNPRSRKLKLLIRRQPVQTKGLPENLNEEILKLLRFYIS